MILGFRIQTHNWFHKLKNIVEVSVSDSQTTPRAEEHRGDRFSDNPSDLRWCPDLHKCNVWTRLLSTRTRSPSVVWTSVSYFHRSISVSFSELRNIASHSYRADEHRLGTDSLAIHPYPPQSLGSHLMPWPPMCCLDQFWLDHPSPSYLFSRFSALALGFRT